LLKQIDLKSQVPDFQCVIEYQIDVSITVTPPNKVVGIFDVFEVTWKSPKNHNNYDKISLYLRKSDNTALFVSAVYILFSGQADTSTQPGTYFAVYTIDSTDVNIYSEDFPIIVRNKTYTISVDSTVPIATPFEVSWTAPFQHFLDDEIALYYETSPGIFNKVATQLVMSPSDSNGTLQFYVPTPGNYVAKYQLSVNSQSVATGKFYAKAVGYTVTVPKYATVNKTFDVSWYAPINHSEFDSIMLAFYHPEMKSFSYAKSITVGNEGVSSGKIQFSATDPGEYICFYSLYSTLQSISSSSIFNVNSSVIY